MLYIYIYIYTQTPSNTLLDNVIKVVHNDIDPPI